MDKKDVISDVEFASRIQGIRGQFYIGLKDRGAFWKDIGIPWFAFVFPEKHKLYGSEGLQLLGPLHCISDFIGCFSRWKRMKEQGIMLDHPSLLDAVSDAFGYAVLMSTTSKIMPLWERVNVSDGTPQSDADMLLGLYWNDLQAVDRAAVTIATRCVFNMWAVG